MLSPLVAATTAHTVFDVLVVAHVVCAVLGFGALMLTGVYGFAYRRPDAAGMEEARRYFGGQGRLELLVLIVPFLGAAALLVQPRGPGLGQLWDLLAAGVWLVAAVVLFAVVRPAERRLRDALAVADGEGEWPVVATNATRLGWAGLGTDLAFVVALLLMIFQPR
ncbi:MAG TPA: DUF2269 family protein [Acidimicrobiales bacterium]|nr:DUF2269 family protein [Acidimicrobiales bacterium]